MRAALSGHRERAVDEAMGEAPGDPSARLYVEELKLTNFRNYERAGVRLDERPVVLVGDNGAGTTNLLEAVSLLGPGQGLRGRDYGELARKDGPGGWAVAATVMSLEGLVEKFVINWVWMPPWGMEKITADGRDQLRALGFNV